MYSLQALIKSALLVFSAASLIFWLPPSFLRSHPGTHFTVATINHDGTPMPIKMAPESADFQSYPARSQHAYVFYATEPAYACSALVNIDRLRNMFNSTYRIIVIAKPTLESQYLHKFISYNATVLPYQPPPIPAEYSYYADVLLKLVSFRLHQYIPSLERILLLDADQLIYQSLDHLFLLPAVDLAAPRVYWEDDPAQVTSALMLIKLSDRVWDKVNATMSAVEDYKFDMNIVNDIFRNFTMILPGDYCTLNSHLEDNWLPAWYEGNQWAIANAREQGKWRTPPPQGKHGLTNTTSGKIVEKQLDNLLKRQTSKSTEMHEEDIELPDLAQIGIQEEANRMFEHALKEKNEKLSEAGDDTSEMPQSDWSPPPGPVEAPPSVAAPPEEHLSDEERKEKETSKLRWRKHDLMGTLQKVYDEDVKVLHFSAVDKPWRVTEDEVRSKTPDAHPLLAEQYRRWRLKAKQICPGLDNIDV